MRSTPIYKKPALFCTRPWLGLALAVGFVDRFPDRRRRRPAPLPFVLPQVAPAALPARRPTPAPAVKTVQAVRAAEPIALDGRLDEAVWKAAPAATGFTQNDPEDGSPATEPTDVWVAYDDHALYVAAFCRDSDPSKIRKRLGRRDTQTDSDWFMVAVDPYFDKRSGYAFYTNPAGSITDAALSNDVNDDDTWDGVWETKAAVNDAGWTVEIRIPFNQIRFPKKDEYVWGVNFRRMVRRKNEQSTFNWIPKSEAAYVSRFARLEGLRGISPGGRVEFMPYAVTQAEFRPEEPGNPVRDRAHHAGQRRLRPQGRPQEQPDARRDGQSGLRAGRGRPGGPQPLGLRDLLRGEAAVLHRGRVALQQLRARRRLHERQHQLAAAAVLLQPAHRARAAGVRDRAGVRERARPDDDPGRGQGHREARRQLERRVR